MPNPFIKRYQKHVTIKLSKGQRITIIRPKQGVSVIAHPLDEANKKNPQYANISLVASNVLCSQPNLNDMDEKIEQTLSSLNIVSDNAKDDITKQMTDPNRHKRGPSNRYFYESPELDGQFDYLRSRLQKIRMQYMSKEQVRKVNKIFVDKLGYDHGLNESVRCHPTGELVSDNAV